MKIIAAYAGTGKTFFSRLYPHMVEDFVCMPYKYQLEPIAKQEFNNNDFDSIEKTEYYEDCKANPNNIFRDEWPLNYVHIIKQKLIHDKIILIPSDILVLALLRNEKIPYTLCYPQRNAKNIYRERFIARGNTDKFIDIFIGRWDIFIDSFEQDKYGKHIVLQQNQYLSDVIKM